MIAAADVILALTKEPSTVWYFARAAGFVSLLLLTATVALGIAVTLRLRSRSWPAFMNEDLHRYIGVVLFVFIGVHVVTIWLDPFTKFSLAAVLVPFAGSYRTLSMGLGICAAELALALALSLHLRRWIGYRAWRILHYGTYITYPISLWHGLGTGSDTHTWWGMGTYATSGLTVAVLLLLRVQQGSDKARPNPGRDLGSERPAGGSLA